MTNPAANDDEATPRWVKVSGAIALVALVLFVIVHVVAGGLGGPHFEGHLPQVPTTSDAGAAGGAVR